jgi:hypothetical protein
VGDGGEMSSRRAGARACCSGRIKKSVRPDQGERRLGSAEVKGIVAAGEAGGASGARCQGRTRRDASGLAKGVTCAARPPLAAPFPPPAVA